MSLVFGLLHPSLPPRPPTQPPTPAAVALFIPKRAAAMLIGRAAILFGSAIGLFFFKKKPATVGQFQSKSQRRGERTCVTVARSFVIFQLHSRLGFFFVVSTFSLTDKMPIVQLSASPSDLPFGFGTGSRSSMLGTSMMAAGNSIRGRVSPAKRRLNFGDDDHDDESVRQQNLRRLQSQVDHLIEQQKLRWNFDFIRERPLPGNYTWQPVATDVHLNNNNNNQGLKRSLVQDATLDDNRKMARTDVHIWDVHNNNNRNTSVRHLQGQTKITGNDQHR
jgi:Cyclin-dependent kinase inhibitor